VGIVRDKDTGKPLAGAIVEGDTRAGHGRSGFIQTTTDKDGRYRLDGLPKADGNQITVRTNDFIPPSGGEMSSQMPYLSAVKTVGNPLGLEPVTVDFALKRGIWVKGRVTDKSTGKPLWAGIQYFCFNDNPNAKEISSIGKVNWRSSREDGSFHMPVLPGRGLIAVRAQQDHYVMGVGSDKIKGPRTQDSAGFLLTTPYLCYPGNFHTLVEVNPKPGEESIRCDVTLDPGRTLKGTVIGSDGKPLAGARIAGLKDMGYWQENAGTDFTVESLLPNKPRVLQFMHEGKKLAGILALRGEEKGPLTVRLKPWCALTGRLVTQRGEPLTGVHVSCRMEVTQNGKILDTTALDVPVDKGGRFRIEGLPAGHKYRDFYVVKRPYVLEFVGGEPKGLTLQAGETKDLGDLTVKPME
jgi:hypothetical protein